MLERISVLIADGDPEVRAVLRGLLEGADDVDVAGEAENGAQAVAFSLRLQPDLLLLDVSLPDMDGIEVAEALSQIEGPQMVFVTDCDRSLSRAFDLRAIDYLRKPVETRRFSAMLSHARRRVVERRLYERFREGPSPLPAPAPTPETRTYPERLPIRSPEGDVVLVRSEEIELLEGESGGVTLHLVHGKVQWKTRLIDAERLLDPGVFVRIARAGIVNVRRIQTIRPLWKREYVLILQSGRSVPTGRSYADALEGLMNLI